MSYRSYTLTLVLAYPLASAYFPSAIGATVYRAMGIDPRSELRDREGRPYTLNQGEAIEALF